MSYLIMIPARMGSTRFPGKALAEIGGKTLIQLVCERAARLPGASGLRVATDHPEILAHVGSLGYEAVMTDVAHQSGSDRIAEALGDWDGLVLNLQGDEPLFEIDTVASLLSRLEGDEGIPMGTVAVPLATADLDNSDRVKALRGADGFALDFRRELSAEHASGDEDPSPAADAPTSVGGISAGVEILLHAGIYLYRREALDRFVAAPPSPREKAERLEQLRALDMGLRIWIERGSTWAPGVDRPEDLKVVAKLLADE